MGERERAGGDVSKQFICERKSSIGYRVKDEDGIIDRNYRNSHSYHIYPFNYTILMEAIIAVLFSSFSSISTRIDEKSNFNEFFM
jgi:hypothetical protein